MVRLSKKEKQFWKKSFIGSLFKNTSYDKQKLVEDTIISCLAVYNPEDLFEDIIC